MNELVTSEKKTPHPQLAKYIEIVVPRAYQRGMLKSDYGWLARFGELLGDVDRANVWSWVYVNNGLPRNRVNQVRALNEKLDLLMSDDEFEQLFAARPSREDAKPFRLLFEEVEKSAMENNTPGSVVRKRIADFIGVTSRTLYRYEAEGDIPPRRKGQLKDAIKSLNIKVPDEVFAAVFDS